MIIFFVTAIHVKLFIVTYLNILFVVPVPKPRLHRLEVVMFLHFSEAFDRVLRNVIGPGIEIYHS